MSEKLINFRFDDSKYQELKMLALKERKPVKILISSLLDEYIKNHKDGNPQFNLDQFADPDFIACPAFFRDKRSWDQYISKATPEELQKIKQQIIILDNTLVKYL